MKCVSLMVIALLIGFDVHCQWTHVDTVNEQYYGIHFINDTEGYIGSNGFYKKSMDGGLSWQVNNLPGPAGYAAQFNFFDNGIILAGSTYASYKSGDNGSTWGTGNTNYPCYFLPNSLVGFSAVYMPFGHATPTFKTTDAGNTWIQQGWITPNPNGAFTGAAGISFSDLRHGCIVAGEGSVYITSNGGLNWQRQTPYDSTYNFSDVFMQDSLNIFVVGGYSPSSSNSNYVILKTADGGINWNAVYISGASIKKITFINSSYGFAGGYNLLKTIDGGNTWTADINIYGVVDFSFPEATIGFLLTWDAVYGKGSVNQLRISTSIIEPNISSDVKVFPNPTTTQLYIKTENIQPETLSIYDVNDQVIYTMPFKPEIDVSKLSSGVYFVEVKNSSLIARKRFVKM